ncbi:MAG: hypothetical protein QNJ33_11865 [Crocosphaera sp.]|nr:hypothetical protein [Crocosphaera sp.]
MDNTPLNIKENFLYAISPYRGTLTQDRVIFNTKLQEFSQKVAFIASLYSSGKLPSEEAYYRVESLWRELESTKVTIFDNQ